MATRYYDESDLSCLRRWLESNQDSRSEKLVSEFEIAFADALGAPYVMANASAMLGLQMALQIAGVGPGDEVIVDPIVTFAGLAVMYCNSVPVFADIEPDTFNMSANSLRACLSDRTKAVICTHFAGLPCDMDGINSIARERNILVIEDCAHALYASYKGRPAGLLGDIGVFSFNHRKQLSTGQGGVMTFGTEELLKEGKRLLFGRIPERLTWNVAMPGIVAAVALAQLPKARNYVTQDQRTASLMTAAVRGCDWIIPQACPPDRVNAFHLWTAVYKDDETVVPMAEFRRICLEEGADYFLFGFMPENWHGFRARPAYAYPVFSEPIAYGKGCPTRCPHYSGEMDYTSELCPVAEKISPRLVNTALSPITEDRGKRLAEALHRAVQRCL